MATRTAEVIALAGLDPTMHAAEAGGDQFTPTRRTVLYVENTDASSHDVTVVTTKTVSGQAVDDLTVPVPAGEWRLIGPFDPTLFAGADGLADLTWSAVTGMQFAVVRM